MERHINTRMITWVLWESVCKSKSDEGLTLKHFETFNIALLSKWAQKTICNHDSPWLRLLSFKIEILRVFFLTNIKLLAGKIPTSGGMICVS